MICLGKSMERIFFCTHPSTGYVVRYGLSFGSSRLLSELLSTSISFREPLWITRYLVCLDVGLSAVQLKTKKWGHNLHSAQTTSVIIWKEIVYLSRVYNQWFYHFSVESVVRQQMCHHLQVKLHSLLKYLKFNKSKKLKLFRI